MNKETMGMLRKKLEACMKDPSDSQVSGDGGFLLKNGKKVNPAVVAREFSLFLLSLSVEAMEELDGFYSQIDGQDDDRLHRWKEYAILWSLNAVRDHFEEEYERLGEY